MEAAASSNTTSSSNNANLASRSFVWTFFVRFDIPADFKNGDPDAWKSQADCKLCSAAISLGS